MLGSMLSPTLFSAQLFSFLLVIYTTAVLCIGETEIHGKVHSSEFSSTINNYGSSSNKTYEKFVCERSRLEVECDKDEVIDFIQANYGRKTLSKCNPNENANLNVNCVSSYSEKVMRERCHQKRSCSARAANLNFGDPCPATEKYLEIQYRCVKGNEKFTKCPNMMGLFLHPTDCTKYYKCIFFVPSLHTCPNNGMFDGIRKECKPANEVHCGTRNKPNEEVTEVYVSTEEPTPKRTTSEGNKQFHCPGLMGFFLHPTDCAKYYKCTFFKPSLRTCPNSGLFDGVKRECKPANEVHCGSRKNPYANIPFSVTACEYTTLNVECERGKVIHSIQANYGRTTLSKCNPDNIQTWSVDCLHDSTEIMRQKCDGKRNCVVEVSNSVFGETCYGTNKYLEMQYMCVPEEVTTTYLSTERISQSKTTPEGHIPLSVTACENTKLNVECERGKVIHCIQANYGRTTLSECNTDNIKTWNVNCLHDSTEIMRQKCDGKRDCVVEASNSVFGETCYGTIKYLELQYMCVPEKVTTTYLRTERITPSKTTSEEEVTTTYLSTERISPSKTTPEDNPDIRKTDPEISTKDNIVVTIVPDTSTETISQTTNFHEETSDSSTSKTTNNPLGITTITECDEQDLKCLNFKCPQDMGSFPHPVSKTKFIFCINWKPRVKSCGTGLLFSEKLMTCVN